MRRREFIALVGGAVGWPAGLHAQQQSTIPKVGYLFSFTPSEDARLWEACRQGLRELGYIEGRNISIEARWADGSHKRLPDLVADLLGRKVDVLVAAATPASLAAKAATSTIPIVIVAVADPVRVGLVASLARPGGNVTGLSLLTPELSGRRLQMIAEMLPQLTRLGVLANPDNLSYALFLEETMSAAQQIGAQIQPFHARNPDQIEQAFQSATTSNLQGLIVFDDPVIWSHRKKLVALAAKTRLPVMYGYSDFVSDGGLISYGPHRPDMYRRTAVYVDKILKGAKPADLPVEQPTKFQLVINLKTVRGLGLTAPAKLLAQADEVIE